MKKGCYRRTKWFKTRKRKRKKSREPELALKAEPVYSNREGLEGKAFKDDLKNKLGKLKQDVKGEQDKIKLEEEK